MALALGLALLSALAVPWLMPRARSMACALVVAVPLALFIYFVICLPSVLQGDRLATSLEWSPGLGLRLALALDGLSVLFALIISGVGSLITLYALGYMRGHPQLGRFFAFLLVFMVSMLGLVLADDLLTLFVFWEFTSYSSYFLIGFDHASEKARAAAWQALLITAAGGLAMLAGFLLIGSITGTFALPALVEQGATLRAHALYPFAFGLVMLGAMTKSAQFPFHFWLPNAMQAPTPVSAYLHSSTMVKAGVYLLARLYPVLGGTPLWTHTLIVVGTLTMAVSAYLSIEQRALKRLLAYSTTWALGLMVLLLGIGGVQALEALMVWVLAHALYKGALFMVAGNYDHGAGAKHVQEVAGIRRLMPYTVVAGLIAACSMSGLPPTLGFVAKELLYESILASEWAAQTLVVVATASTAAMVLVALKIGVEPLFGQPHAPREGHEVGGCLLLGPGLLSVLGFAAVLASPWLGAALLGPAVAALVDRPVAMKLGLWHGLELPLLFSATSLMLGGMAYLRRHRLQVLEAWTRRLARFGPERLYASSIAGTLRVAAWQFRVLQNGYLRRYVMTVVWVVLLLVGGGLLAFVPLVGPSRLQPVQLHEVGLALTVMVGAIGVLFSRTRLTAVALLGVVGYGIALLFLFFGAPDLALTQFIIETLTLIMFMFAFYRLPQFARLSPPAARVRDAIIAGLMGLLMAGLAFVTLQEPADPTIQTYYGYRSFVEGHGRNIVNVILVDFRAFDTLGEITVLSLAAIGVFALVRKWRGVS